MQLTNSFLPLNVDPSIAHLFVQPDADTIKAQFCSARDFISTHFNFSRISCQRLYLGTSLCYAQFLIQQGELQQAQQVISHTKHLSAEAVSPETTEFQCDRLTALIEQKLRSKETS